MPETTFLRLLAHDDKPAALAAAVDALRAGNAHPDAFSADPASFQQVPGSPFAYWASSNILRHFATLEPYELGSRTVRQGLATADDFRFVRFWTEVCPDLYVQLSDRNLNRYVDMTKSGKIWVGFAKGGSFSTFYSDIHLVVNWYGDGQEVKEWICKRYEYLNGKWEWVAKNTGFYFRPGLTWPLRTQLGLNFRIFPEGCIFGHKGPVAFSQAFLERYLGVGNSKPFRNFVSLQMAFGSYEVGVIQRTPVPPLDNPQGERLGELALACVELKRDLDRANETSHVFHLPALLQVPGATLAERTAAWAARVADTDAQLAANQREIDDIAFALYGIDPSEVSMVSGPLSVVSGPLFVGSGPLSVVSGPLSVDGDPSMHDDDEAMADDEQRTTDNGQPTTDNQQPTTNNGQRTTDLLSYAVGCAFGRWDIRYATGERPTPTLPDPFAPLPACSPGMLSGDDGLPLRHAPAGYPLPLDADGILVDDPGHPDDLVGRMRAALEVIFGDGADAIEREACAALGVESLREYMRRPGPGGFWQDHIRRYSKSRRKAPIYWLLQSPKKHYALWLYLHRLDGDTLSKALVSYVEPKLRREEERLERVQASRAGLAGRELRQAERDIERQEAVIADVREFRDRLDRTAKRYLAPDLNDGVVLTIAPLHELVPWREAKQYWDELLAGKYEWSSIGKQLREKGQVK
jgi:hypothetical protein